MYFIYKSKTTPTAYFPLEGNLTNAMNTGDGVLDAGVLTPAAPVVYGPGGSIIVGADAGQFYISTDIFQTKTLGDYFYLECMFYWVSGDSTGVVKLFGHAGSDGLRVYRDKVNFTIIHQNKTIVIESPIDTGSVYLARVEHTGDRVTLYLNNEEVGTYVYDGTEGPMIDNSSIHRLYFGPNAGAASVAVSHIVVSNKPYVEVPFESVVEGEDRVLSTMPGTRLSLTTHFGNELEWDSSEDVPIPVDDVLQEDGFYTSNSLGYAYFNFPIEPGEGDTIHGVLLEYDSNNTVEVSTDGDNWTLASDGALVPVITPGQVVTEMQLTFRARLEAGTRLKGLRARVIESNDISMENRPVTLGGNAVLRSKTSPLPSIKDGVALNGGTLTVASQSDLTETALSFWYKGTSLSVTGQTPTLYLNGEEFDSDNLAGRWVFVTITDAALPIVITGDGVMKNIMAHPSLTQAQSLTLYQAHTNHKITVNNTDAVQITGDQSQGFNFVWQIVTGGN